jgi:hypothetical protein
MCTALSLTFEPFLKRDSAMLQFWRFVYMWAARGAAQILAWSRLVTVRIFKALMCTWRRFYLSNAEI